MSNEIKCPHCGEAFTVDESGYAAILNQVRDQEFQREVDARVSLAEKSREQEVALAVTKAEEALRATCGKFRVRWAFMEGAAAGGGRRVEDISMEEMEELWQLSKVLEGDSLG